MLEIKSVFKEYGKAEKIAFLSLLIQIAKADGQLEEQEVQTIKEFIQVADLETTDQDAVVRLANMDSQIDVDANLSTLKGSPLKYALLLNTIFMAHADGVLEPEEIAEIERFSKAMDIQEGQVKLLNDFAAEIVAAKNTKATEDDMKKIREKHVQGLLDSGIPKSALIIGGEVASSFFGLDALGSLFGKITELVMMPIKATFKGIRKLFKF